MKKNIIILISILISSFLLAACGALSSEEQNTVSQITQETSENQSEATSPPADEITIEETLLVDKEGIIIKATSLNLDGFMGPEVNLYIENNTETDITIQSRNASVNGIMTEPIFSCDIAAGKKINDELTFTYSELEKNAIVKISKLELVFHVFNSDSWDNIFDSEIVNINTSIADGYVQQIDFSGQVLFEENDVKIIYKELNSEGLLGPGATVTIQNNSQQNITVQSRDCSINGFMVEPVFSCDIAAGKTACDSITFMSSDIENNNIDKIEEIELKFNISNSDSWDTIVETGIVKITIP